MSESFSLYIRVIKTGILYEIFAIVKLTGIIEIAMTL